MAQETYIDVATREFARLHDLADRAMTQVDDDQFFIPLGNDENSIGTIVKHTAGNMRSRWRDFLTSDGEKPDRDRDREFAVVEADTRAELQKQWTAGWRMLFDALQPLTDADLPRTVTIRGEGLTVLQAINRQLTHYAYHVGQLVMLARHFAAANWQTLSVPKGGSQEFNADPKRYLDDGKR